MEILRLPDDTIASCRFQQSPKLFVIMARDSTISETNNYPKSILGINMQANASGAVPV